MQTKQLDRPKAPAEVLDFVFDFTNELSLGDMISSAAVTLDPPGSLTLESMVVASPKVTQWATDGTPLQSPHLICTATTAQGRKHVMVWIVPVGDP